MVQWFVGSLYGTCEQCHQGRGGRAIAPARARVRRRRAGPRRLLPYLDPDGRFAAVLPRGPVRGAPGRRATCGTACSTMPAAPVTPPRSPSSTRSSTSSAPSSASTAREAIFARVLAGRAGSRSGSDCSALDPERTAPAGVLAMSPVAIRRRATLDAAAAGKVPVLIQHGTHDPLIPVQRCARPRARTARRSVSPPCSASTRWSTTSRSRACATRATGSPRCSRARSPTKPCPTTRSSSCRRSPPRSGSPRCCRASCP